MRLRQLQLHNYRSFGDATVDLEDVTLLTGPNNAGKSMLLDSVRCLLARPERQVSGRGNWGWEDLAQRPRANLAGQDEWMYSGPEGPVWIIGIFDELLEGERLRYMRYLVSGRLQLGAYFPEWDQLTSVETRYLVLPEGHKGANGPLESSHQLEGGWRPFPLPERHEIWRPYREDLDLCRIDPRAPELAFDSSFVDGPPLPVAVDLLGLDRAVPSARELLRPFMERRVDDLVASLPLQLREHIEQLARGVGYEIGSKLNEIAPVYVSESARVAVRTADQYLLRKALLAAVGDLELHVSLGAGALPEPWDPTVNELPPGAERLETTSGGLQRAVCLSILELYADADLWPVDKSVILLIDEPELGLHAAAQRRLAKALSRLRDRTGVQALIVTHSPTLINSAKPSGIRIVHRRIDGDHDSSEVVATTDLRTVTEALGATPADVLLGECFVVVEGATEKAVLPVWAQTLGIDLENARVELFAAEGWSNETTLARLMELAYPGARLYALLDGGPGPEAERARMLKRFGGRVSVKVLTVTEIEGAYTESAVKRWIEANGGDASAASGFAAHASAGSAKDALKKLTYDQWHRSYKVVEDGAAIAARMSAGEISAEIGEWLHMLVAD